MKTEFTQFTVFIHKPSKTNAVRCVSFQVDLYCKSTVCVRPT